MHKVREHPGAVKARTLLEVAKVQHLGVGGAGDRAAGRAFPARAPPKQTNKNSETREGGQELGGATNPHRNTTGISVGA